MIELRDQYTLKKVIAAASSDYERILALGQWVHAQWEHNGINDPSKGDALTILREAEDNEGFRCVEYATVFAACAQTLGMPARVLGLMRADVAEAQRGAGHVVAEVWSGEYGKWIFVDPQEAVVPELRGTPLNAVEFQAALKDPDLVLRGSPRLWEDAYVFWIAPYLYYLNFNRDQRQFADDTDTKPENQRILLMPEGASVPASFQGKAAPGDAFLVVGVEEFYAPPKDGAFGRGANVTQMRTKLHGTRNHG